MKLISLITFTGILLLGAGVLTSRAQQTLVQTVTKGNLGCNSTCSVVDVPDLANNPDAIVFVTPLRSGRSNPHRIGAYYMYLKKWSIFNLDGVAMVEGATFQVEYYVRPEANQFVYTVQDSGSCIDHVGLNGDARSQLRIFPTSSPTRGALFSKGDVSAQYNTKSQRWCVTTTEGPPAAGTSFNISFTRSTGETGAAGAATSPSPMDTSALQTTTVMSSTLPTVAQAPPAPLVVVSRAEWALPDQGNITLSPGYCKVIYGSYDDPMIKSTDIALVTGQQPDSGEWLKWTATVNNGSVQLNVCNSQKASLGASGALMITGRKVNILVVR